MGADEDFSSLLDDSLEGALGELRSNVVGEVKQYVDERKLLDPLLRSLTSKKDLDKNTVIDLTMKNVVEAIQAQAISILLLEGDDQIHFKHVYYSNLLYAGSAQLKAAYEAKTEELKGIVFPKTTGIAGRVISSGETYVAFDAQNDPNFYAGIDNDTGFVTKSMITVPLKGKDGETFGVCQVLNKEGGEQFSNMDVGMLEEVASYSSRAIQKIFFPDTEFTENDFAFYKARLTRNEFKDLLDPGFELDTKLLELVDEEIWKRCNFLPIEKEGQNAIALAMSDPLDFGKRQDFEIKSQFKIGTVYVASGEAITDRLKGFYSGAGAAGSLDMGDVMESVGEQYGEKKEEDVEKLTVDKDADEDSAPIIKLSNRIIEDAYVKGASDIHVESFEDYVLVRYRLDGICQKILELPASTSKPLMSRFKIMSKLDIAERRKPQSGRIVFKEFTSTNIDVDLRVEVAPMNHGEKACMRILDKSKSTLPLEKLGFSDYNLERYREVIKTPFGMILHVGPTGSGKSMTLYSALNEIYTPEINIHTAEDPIEYTLEGLNQMQMNPKAGLTFASALRSFLRMDPDTILVGEIRDTETAEIAIEAALTGHLLLSTLHTNDAAGTVARFTEMGVETFMISSSLLVVCAQRLMRRLCGNCKMEHKPEDWEAKLLDLDDHPDATVFKANPKGCEKCGEIGYKGRVGTHELLIVNEPIRNAINAGQNTDELKMTAINEGGMVSLHKDSMDKVRLGITDVEEALRVVRPDD